MYGDFITKNAGAVSQIESALRSLTYIVPARFKDVELASESLHSGIQLLSLYHDSLLARSPALANAAASSSLPREKPSPHNRYTKFWTTRSPSYRRVALLITMIQYTELLWEMAAKRRGKKMRWHVVIVLETVKALCRLLLLRLTNSRPLLTPPLPEREIDPAALEESSVFEPESPPPGEATGWKMPRTGLELPSLPNSGKISQYLLSKVLTAEDVKPPAQLLHRIRGTGYLAEVLYILRPVVYAVAMKRFANDRKSWTPWLLGFSLEYAARQMTKRELETSVPGGLRGLTQLERDELTRRAWAMGWWGVRGAFYENITGPFLQGISGRLNNQPVLGLLGGVLEDYQYLWDNYYFSSATL
ncbi:peroxisome membrane protein [Tricharina praecox]|uniref:peroxisome membrane protein n=1 Tax=Tricharina praecox TaxID=43433 RepID=UPI00221F982B|nr:peroxisome membrane protein [Tricharina praecox]KAI5852296.1 peroxisome membrane protein [Tricharina praecox]